MLYRTMPKNGDQLSVLGFGCMRLPMADGKIDEPRAVSQIREAIDAGVNYVDTAWPYVDGQSEPWLGKALQDGYREKVKVATKLPTWAVKTREDMDGFLNAQLERIGLRQIDYYLVHALFGDSWDRLCVLGVRAFLDQAKQDGRIVNAGFSFHGLGEDFIRIVDDYDWDFCQIQYNYLDEDYQAGKKGMQYAASKNLGVIIMEPLRGGNLALPEAPPSIAEIWDKARIKRTPAEWGLRWVWNHPEVTVVLSGMNDESQVRENLAIADQALPGSLNADELDLVGLATKKYQQLMHVGCTGCAYCMPCPMDVQIPACFDFYNRVYLFGNEKECKRMYTNLVGGALGDTPPGFASQCVACGSCLEKCPQHINIPEFLEKAVAVLESGN